MTDKQNRIENDAAGCARLQEVAFTLSAKQGIAIATLCSGAGVDAAAAAAEVNPSTIWRWRELPQQTQLTGRPGHDLKHRQNFVAQNAVTA